MSNRGPGTDTTAAFPQLRNEYYVDFTPTGSSPTSSDYYIKMGPNFGVDKDGVLFASGATFKGTITASAGLIGGFTTDDDAFYTGTKNQPNFFISGAAVGDTISNTNW